MQLEKPCFSVSSSFQLEVRENCPLLGYYAASNRNSLLTFRDNLSIPSSRVKMGRTGCAEMSVRNCHYSLCNISEDSRYQLCVCS